jgi:hypothetical protein
MATNLALVSLTDNVKNLTADINRIQKAYDSLKNKSTKYAFDHQALLMAYKEVLAVYVRHLKAAQQSFAVDAKQPPAFCGRCGSTACTCKYGPYPVSCQ